jgi:hypothetical protein
MFSSAIPGAVPAKCGASASVTAACGPPMGTVSSAIPSRAATSAASSSDVAEVKRDGSITPRTASGPSASAAIAATSAESTPPDRPSSTRRMPDLPM